MRKSRFTEAQLIGYVKELEGGAKAPDVARRAGVTETTLYRWKSKYAGLDVSDAKRLHALEEENRRLKQIVADQALDLQGLKYLVSKKW
jgi:putative transposase